MKNNKILLVFAMIFLLGSLVSAYYYTIEEHLEKDMTRVNYTASNTNIYDYWFNSMTTYCSSLKTGTKCTQTDYTNWIAEYMNIQIPDLEKALADSLNEKTEQRTIPDQTKEDLEEIVDTKQTIDDTDTFKLIKDLYAKLKTLIIWVAEIDNRTTTLEQENELLKNELCKKDESYAWCKTGVEPK